MSLLSAGDRRIRPSFTRCRNYAFAYTFVRTVGCFVIVSEKGTFRGCGLDGRKPNGWHALAQHPSWINEDQKWRLRLRRMRLLFYSAFVIFETLRLLLMKSGGIQCPTLFQKGPARSHRNIRKLCCLQITL